jgi:hypothetical protein
MDMMALWTDGAWGVWGETCWGSVAAEGLLAWALWRNCASAADSEEHQKQQLF